MRSWGGLLSVLPRRWAGRLKSQQRKAETRGIRSLCPHSAKRRRSTTETRSLFRSLARQQTRWRQTIQPDQHRNRGSCGDKRKRQQRP